MSKKVNTKSCVGKFFFFWTYLRMSCNIVFGSMSREDKGGFPLYFTQPSKLPGSNKRYGLREIGKKPGR